MKEWWENGVKGQHRRVFNVGIQNKNGETK